MLHSPSPRANFYMSIAGHDRGPRLSPSYALDPGAGEHPQNEPVEPFCSCVSYCGAPQQAPDALLQWRRGLNRRCRTIAYDLPDVSCPGRIECEVQCFEASRG